jgi:hypothetical protein
MRILWKLLTSTFMIGLAIGCVFAQESAPPANKSDDIRVIRVRIFSSGGMWCDCYCSEGTSIEAFFVVWEGTNAGDKRLCPDKKERRAITKHDWENLQSAIDTKAFMALPSPESCLACVDLPESSMELDFSDGTKKSVSYAPSKPPAPIDRVLQKVNAIGAGFPPEPVPNRPIPAGDQQIVPH